MACAVLQSLVERGIEAKELARREGPRGELVRGEGSIRRGGAHGDERPRVLGPSPVVLEEPVQDLARDAPLARVEGAGEEAQCNVVEPRVRLAPRPRGRSPPCGATPRRTAGRS